MSEKRKSTLSAKVLTILIIVLFAGAVTCFVYAVCTGTFSKEIMAEVETVESSSTASSVTSVVDGTDATTSTAATQTTTDAFDKNGAVANASFIVAPSYKAKGAVDANGDKVDLRAYFGSGFANYGGALKFDGNRFTLNMGVSANSDSSKGEYDIVSMTELQLKFDNSDITSASFVSEDKTITSIDVPMDDIVVTFVAE